MSERKGFFGSLFGGGKQSASDEPWSRFYGLFQELNAAVDTLSDLGDAGNDGRAMDSSAVDRARSQINSTLDRIARAVADYNRGLEEDRRSEERSDTRPVDTKSAPGAHNAYR